ncbi:hypothetical protein [Flavobacterium columnare]|uniref:hypothetical protein n=1 Tax=Flavobacterium columnare TaxID=996 RepID=UPI0040342630
MNKETKENCLKDIIKKAHKSTIQSCVNLRTPFQLAYVHSNIVEDYFNVKKGTSSFGEVAQDLFSEFKVNHIEMDRIKKEIRQFKFRYKHTISIVDKQHYKEEHNKLVETERELYKPIRKFVKLCNKVRSENIA